MGSIEVLQTIDLEAKLFGEGLTIFEDIIVQTTWRENVGLVYDKKTLEPKSSFEYPYEGWYGPLCTSHPTTFSPELAIANMRGDAAGV